MSDIIHGSDPSHASVYLQLEEYVKKKYDSFKGNPDAMEQYIIKRLQEELFSEKPRKVSIPKGCKVIFDYDDEGHIIDMRFERIH